MIEWLSCGRISVSGAAAAGVIGAAPSAKRATCSKTSKNRPKSMTIRRTNQSAALTDRVHADRLMISPDRVRKALHGSDPVPLLVRIRGSTRPCLNSDGSASTNPHTLITSPTIPMRYGPARVARERLYFHFNPFYLFTYLFFFIIVEFLISTFTSHRLSYVIWRKWWI